MILLSLSLSLYKENDNAVGTPTYGSDGEDGGGPTWYSRAHHPIKKESNRESLSQAYTVQVQQTPMW